MRKCNMEITGILWWAFYALFPPMASLQTCKGTVSWLNKAQSNIQRRSKLVKVSWDECADCRPIVSCCQPMLWERLSPFKSWSIYFWPWDREWLEAQVSALTESNETENDIRSQGMQSLQCSAQRITKIDSLCASIELDCICDSRYLNQCLCPVKSDSVKWPLETCIQQYRQRYWLPGRGRSTTITILLCKGCKFVHLLMHYLWTRQSKTQSCMLRESAARARHASSTTF